MQEPHEIAGSSRGLRESSRYRFGLNMTAQPKRITASNSRRASYGPSIAEIARQRRSGSCASAKARVCVEPTAVWLVLSPVDGQNGKRRDSHSKLLGGLGKWDSDQPQSTRSPTACMDSFDPGGVRG